MSGGFHGGYQLASALTAAVAFASGTLWGNKSPAPIHVHPAVSVDTPRCDCQCDHPPASLPVEWFGIVAAILVITSALSVALGVCCVTCLRQLTYGGPGSAPPKLGGGKGGGVWSAIGNATN